MPPSVPKPFASIPECSKFPSSEVLLSVNFLVFFLIMDFKCNFVTLKQKASTLFVLFTAFSESNSYMKVLFLIRISDSLGARNIIKEESSMDKKHQPCLSCSRPLAKVTAT